MASASLGTSATGTSTIDFNEYDIQQLPNIIDVAGDIYYTGDEKPVQLGYKTRADLLKAFNINTSSSSRKTENLNKERLLRTYLYKGVDLSSIQFQPGDKDELIEILKDRANDLKSSLSLNSYSFRQIIPARNYTNLLKLIKELDEHEYKPGWSAKWDKAKEKSKEILRIGQNKKYARELVNNPDRIFETILEMIWFLLHPDLVPEDIKKSWYKVVKGTDNLKARELINAIRDPASGILHQDNPLNYIGQMSISDFSAKETIDDAMGSVIDNIKNNKNAALISRLEKILILLKTKKYLSDDSINQIKDSTVDIEEFIKNNIAPSLLSNPSTDIGRMSGGTVMPLATLMIPFFAHFQEKYSIVYEILQDLVNKIDDVNITYKLSDLLLLIHIIRNVNTDNKNKDKYGVYRIDNIPETLGQFLKYIIDGVNNNTDIDKSVFNNLSDRIPNTYNGTGNNYNLKIKLGFFITESFKKLDDDTVIQPLIEKKISGITVDAFKKDVNNFFVNETNADGKINKTYLCISSDETNIPYKLNTIDMSAHTINADSIITSTPVDPSTSVLLPKNNQFNFNEIIEYRPNNKFILNDGHLILLVLCTLKKLMPSTI